MNFLHGMRLFIEVVECGGFSAAARKLAIQQSTVSRMIGALEEHYNTSFLVRSTRKMRLTEAGTVFLADSRRILGEIDELGIRMRRVREEPRGLLRVGLSTVFGRLFIVPLLAEFKRKYPEIMLEVHLEDRLMDIVAEGYDVVIRVGNSHDSLTTSRKIAEVRRGLFVAKSLLKKLGPVNAPKDLAAFPAILFEDQMPVHPRWTLAQGRSRQRVPIHSATCVNQLDSICALTKDGMGVAHIPLALVEMSEGSGTLERVLPDWEVVGKLENNAGVYVLFSGGSKVRAKVRVFVDHLVRSLARSYLK